MLILASQSPRRSQLLSAAGFTFTVRVAGIPEEREPHETPARYVDRLARQKAAAIESSPDDWVLAADTIVVVDGNVLEKPSSPEDASRMIRLLAGRNHQVLTGVCVRHGAEEWSACETTTVHFLPMEPAEIEQYANSGEPIDKAGGYAIQGLASKFIDRVEGCYHNVVGLPVSLVFRVLKTAGYKPH